MGEIEPTASLRLNGTTCVALLHTLFLSLFHRQVSESRLSDLKKESTQLEEELEQTRYGSCKGIVLHR